MTQLTLFGLFVPEKAFPVSAGNVAADTRQTTAGAVPFDQVLLEALQAGGVKQAKIDPTTAFTTTPPSVESVPLSFLFPTESEPTLMEKSIVSESETLPHIPASAMSEDPQGRLLISLKELSKILEQIQENSEQVPSETTPQEATIPGDGVSLDTVSLQSTTTEPISVDQTNITIEKVSSIVSVLKPDTSPETVATVVENTEVPSEETADLQAIPSSVFPSSDAVTETDSEIINSQAVTINEPEESAPTLTEIQGDKSSIPATEQDRPLNPRDRKMLLAGKILHMQPSMMTQRWNRQMHPSGVATTDEPIKQNIQSVTSQQSAKEDSPVPTSSLVQASSPVLESSLVQTSSPVQTSFPAQESSPVELVVNENGEAFLAFTLPTAQGEDTQVSEKEISSDSPVEKNVPSQTTALAAITSESEVNSQKTGSTPIQNGIHTHKIFPVMHERRLNESESEPSGSSKTVKVAAYTKSDTQFTEASVQSVKLAPETPSTPQEGVVTAVMSVSENVESMTDADVAPPTPQTGPTENNAVVATTETVNPDSTESPSDNTEQQSEQKPEQKPIEVIIRKEDLPAGLQQQVGQNVTLTVVTAPQSSTRDFAQLVLGKEPISMNLTLTNLETAEGESGGKSAAMSLVESAETSVEPQNIAVQKAELDRQLLQPLTTDYEREVEMEYKPEQVQPTASVHSEMDQTGTETMGTAPRTTTTGPSATTQSTAPTQTSNSQAAEAQKVMDQVVKGVSGSLGEGRSHITIRLSPPDLGNVSVRLVMENGALTAKLFAEQANTRSLLEQHANTLRNSLAEQGIKIDNVAVLRESSDRYQPQNERNYQSPERGFRDRDDQTSGNRKDNDPSGQDRRHPRQQQPEWNFSNYFA